MRILAAVATAALLLANTALGAVPTDLAQRVQALTEQKKYLSAVRELQGREGWEHEPELLRLYSHLLVNYYAFAINFSSFSMRDLDPGETIDEVRGAPGDYTIVEGDLEKLLYDAYITAPDEPHLNFAVGEYLSRQRECNCGEPLLFTGEQADPFPYFARAREAGLEDHWSLFVMGLSSHYAGEAESAMGFYRASLERAPDYLPAAYNLAVLTFLAGDVEESEKIAEGIIGRYPDAERNADTHHLMARILERKGDSEGALAHYGEALDLLPWHEGAAPDLMRLYRAKGMDEEYRRLVASYLALDYSNPFTFNAYIGMLAEEGLNETDRQILEGIAAREFEGPATVGAVYFNLGRAALLERAYELALERFERAINAFQSMEKPPPNALDALKSLSAETRQALERR